MGQIKAASRGARENMIVMAFTLSEQRTGSNELTAYDIAFKIGMRAEGPRFRDILSTMVMSGKLLCREVQTKSTGVNGGVRFVYRLAEKVAPKKREVAIKANGKQIGQLRLI